MSAQMHPEARLHALARQADAGQAPAPQEKEKIIIVLDLDLHGFCSPRSGSGSGLGIRIQEQGNLHKLTNKPNLISSLTKIPYLNKYV
jgi:hypothetical protein